MEMNKRLKLLIPAMACAFVFASCMSAEEEDALKTAFYLNAAPAAPVSSAQPACFNERYEQPQAEISRSIDILFVMDTSGSMSDNRAKVADGIASFVGELPSDVDYNVAVMLAHGSKTPWSGKLFSYNGTTIFESKKMSVGDISTKLKQMVLKTPYDSYGEQGEMGSYSLVKGLSTNLEINRQQGFFRADAALAIVFVSDENDICAPYPDEVPFVSEVTMPGLTKNEKVLRNRDCANGVATDQVVSLVKAIQGDRPYLFGAVVHEQVDYRDAYGNDSYGLGYMEIIKATNGVSTEINDGSYTQGLSTMGKLATSKLQLVLDYTLTRANVDASSIEAYVDGAPVGFTYDPTQNDVHLSDGGRALSVVDINYCLQPEQPPVSPDPPSPEPTPSPSPCVGPACGGGFIGV